ncbi:hypothetical protein HMPREF9075_00313 [Capnocytophaga sp. oral taxon 332 str. F0381]|nr:hypothetical protein HMPREF9075_00313 [Capnocytophaga sp. oral taxon 332 str. F0381]
MKKNEINKCATHFVKLSEFDKVFFASLPMPHTLANFQSLTKLIALIINHFYLYCRGDWQIALTNKTFRTTSFFASLPIVPSIQNSELLPPLVAEASPKESRRAGAAEYVTKVERRIKACTARTELAQPSM